MDEYGEPAPGPYAELLLPPAPRALARVDPDAWLYLGILRKQGETLRRVAMKARRMDEAATMSFDDAERRLLALSGVGPWTAGSVMLFGLDLSFAETPHFPGRAVVALASDADPMPRTGQAFWVADLAREYGFTDIDGTIPDAEKLHEQLLKSYRKLVGVHNTQVKEIAAKTGGRPLASSASVSRLSQLPPVKKTTNVVRMARKAAPSRWPSSLTT